MARMIITKNKQYDGTARRDDMMVLMPLMMTMAKSLKMVI